MVEWKDETKGWKNLEIKSSEIRIGCFRLSVHRHINYPEDQWLASCYPGMFSRRELRSKDLDKAKIQAKAMLQVILQEAIDEIVKPSEPQPPEGDG